MLSRTMGPTYFELKLENISVVGMGFILNGSEYLHEGRIMEFGKKIKLHDFV